jgi:hypothetical protein
MPSSYKKTVDVHSVRNKFKVYGVKEKTYPSDKDSWTEGITDWTKQYETQTLTADNANIVRGNYSIKSTVSGANSFWIKRSNIGVVNCLDPWKKSSFKNLRFMIWWALSGGTPPITFSSMKVELHAPDASNYFYRYLTIIATKRDERWIEVDLDLGPFTEAPSGSLDGWIQYGSPSWDNIQAILFSLSTTGVGDLTLYVDRLHFAGARFSSTKEDPTSKTVYGVKCAEPEVDDALSSDAECDLRAESKLAFQKDPIVGLADVRSDGDPRFNPGDRQNVVVSTTGLDVTYPIVNIHEVIRESQWDITLTLNCDPQYVDLLFRTMQQRQRLMERRS